MPATGGAFDFLAGEWAEEFRAKGPTSMLYVGHRSDTSPWWWQVFAPACGITRIAVIDIVRDNANTAQHITGEIYVGDVRDLALVPSGFSLVFWDEGPEHMPRDESLHMIQRLAAVHDRVLVSCPWGFQRQGSGPDDPEFHHWGPEPADFQSIGMRSRCFGVHFEAHPEGGHSSGHGNLVAWTP